MLKQPSRARSGPKLCGTEFSPLSEGGPDRSFRRDVLALVLTLSAVMGLPLLGLLGTPDLLARYGAFPPLTQNVVHASFSWWAFALLALPAALLLGLVAWCWVQVPRVPWRRREGGPMPVWGWMGLALMAVSWFVAWSDIALLTAWRQVSFAPLWFSYILVVNAWVVRRTGRCPMTDRPGRFAALFLVSALFWWSFEFLNRFVENWHYEGVAQITPWHYVLRASLPFATVLPAVLSTEAWLESVPRFEPAFRRFPSLRPRHPRRAAWGALAVGGIGLLLLGRFPEWLFPLLWLAPLMMMIGFQTLLGQAHMLSPLAEGNATRVVRLAVAALVCGFFWEMWNMYSDPRWIYNVPFVNGLHIFEMPLLGFLGYLPFGLECGMISDLIWRQPRENRCTLN